MFQSHLEDDAAQWPMFSSPPPSVPRKVVGWSRGACEAGKIFVREMDGPMGGKFMENFNLIETQKVLVGYAIHLINIPSGNLIRLYGNLI